MLHVAQWSIVCVLSLEDRKFNLFWFCFVVWFFSCWGPIRVTCQGGLWSQVLFAFYQSPCHLPSFFANSRKLKSYLRRSTTWENICKQRNWKLRKYLQIKKLKTEKISANKENENWDNIYKQRNWKLRKYLLTKKLKIEKIYANKEIENWENICKQRNWKLRQFLQTKKMKSKK